MAVIPAFGLLLYSAAQYRELTASQIKQNALGAARIIAAEQDRVLDNAHGFLVTLGRVPQIRDGGSAACGKVLSGLLEPRYADLVVTDRKGNVLCRALPAGNSLAATKGFHLSRSAKTYSFAIGDLRYHPSSKKVLLDLAYPVSDPPGVVRAVVSVALDLSWINHVVVDGHLYPGATFTLVNNAGKVLLRYPGGAEWIGKTIFSDGLAQNMTSRDTEQTIEAAGPDGVRRLFAFSRLKNRPGGQTVFAAIDLPATVAFSKTKQVLQRNLVALGILSLIVLSLAWFGTDAFVLRRIRDIIAATNKMATGDLTARTTLTYDGNELGQMARAFDNLARALEKREAEALESAQQIHQQRRQQEALYDLNRGITSTLDLTSVLTALLDHISAQFPSCAVTVSWTNQQTAALEPIAQRGMEAIEEERDQLESAELPRQVIERQAVVAIPNALQASAAMNDSFRSCGRSVSYLGLPLIARGEILGVLSFYSVERCEDIQDGSNFLKALANEAAIAISNSRLFEQTRQQAAELEKSNKIKDEFLGVMSHELRTPLNIIMNYSEALAMETFGALSAEQQRGTDKIRVQAAHLLSLINGILEITKIESGTITVQDHQFDVAEFLFEVQTDYILPLERNVVLEWDYPADLAVIVCDRVKLKQIVTNLINNAIKFTDEGRVKISARTLPEERAIELKVADTGTGIPEALLPTVFDKFRQIDSATTRNYSGAGLGLYIVKNFVHLLGGRIEVHSQVGVGSEFIVLLPIRPSRTRAENGPLSANIDSAQAM